jgi:hypothetical protein
LRGPLRDVVRQELSPANIRRFGLLDAEGASSLVTGFLQRRPGASAAGVWFLLQLQQWAGRWLQAAPSVEVSVPAPMARSSAG